MTIWIVFAWGPDRTVAGIYRKEEIAKSRRDQLIKKGHTPLDIEIEQYETNTDYKTSNLDDR